MQRQRRNSIGPNVGYNHEWPQGGHQNDYQFGRNLFLQAKKKSLEADVRRQATLYNKVRTEDLNKGFDLMMLDHEN